MFDDMRSQDGWGPRKDVLKGHDVIRRERERERKRERGQGRERKRERERERKGRERV